jgi:hypothetical protein
MPMVGVSIKPGLDRIDVEGETLPAITSAIE